MIFKFIFFVNFAISSCVGTGDNPLASAKPWIPVGMEANQLGSLSSGSWLGFCSVELNGEGTIISTGDGATGGILRFGTVIYNKITFLNSICYFFFLQQHTAVGWTNVSP